MFWYALGALVLSVLVAFLLNRIYRWFRTPISRLEGDISNSGVNADGLNSPHIHSATIGAANGHLPTYTSSERTPLLGASAASSATLVGSSTAATPITVGSRRNAERGFHPKSFASSESSTKHQHQRRGLFNKAHDFMINDSVIVNYDQVQAKDAVLRWVAEHTISGAEFDSSARDPPPQCHPGTRLHVLEMILSWIYDRNRRYRLGWLHGPAGVGKSAIIQSIAESTFGAGVLGATLFFSRPNNRNNPNLVFTTIAYQLAVKIPLYRRYLRSMMTHDPRMLEKGMKELFHLLFVIPLAQAHPGIEYITWVILLDGLDECQGDRAQVEIIHLISNFALKYPNSPLIWVISSRPEPHIKDVFNSTLVKPSRWEHFLPVDSDDSCRDVEMFLSHEFSRIREKYPYIMAPWPTQEPFLRIAKAASGLFVFAVTVAKFIDDPNVGDPITHLNLVLDISASMTQDPLESLHALYTRILDNVPHQVLQTTQLLLGFCLVRKEFGLEDCTFQFACNVLGLAHHVAWAALIKLHSVVRVPIPHFSDASGLSFFHASFGDYLKDEWRSGKYAVDLENVREHLRDRCFRILRDITISDVGNPSNLHVSLCWPRIDPESNTRLKGKLLQKAWGSYISQLLRTFPLVDLSVPFTEKTLERSLGIDDLVRFFGELDFTWLVTSYMDLNGNSSPEDFASWALTAEIPECLEQTGFIQRTSLQFLDLSCVDSRKVSLGFYYRDSQVDLVCSGEAFTGLKQYFPTPSRLDNRLLERVAQLREERLSQLEAGLSDAPVAIVGDRNASRACAVVYTSDSIWREKTIFFLPLR